MWQFEVGFLDGMFATFDAHNHPVVLIGHQATRWMAVQIVVEEEFDLLVRDEQHNSIVRSLLASDWIQVDHQVRCPTDPFLTPDVPRLQRVGEEFYINLWPEHYYCLPIDGDLCEVPHMCAWNEVLIETKFFPNPSYSDRPPRVLADGMDVYLPKKPDQSPDRPCRTPVYIPTIPRYLDACLSRSKRYLATRWPDRPSDVFFSNFAGMEIHNLIRYLYLEMEDQRAKLLPLLSEPNREAMERRLTIYVRTYKTLLRTPNRDLAAERKARRPKRVKILW